MVKIEILQHVRHDGQQFHKGELRIVDEKLAGYFCGNSWAKEIGGSEPAAPDLQDKTLDVHSVKHVHNTVIPGATDNG